MEFRQLRYFVRVVELGSMGRAAQDLGVVTSALSQQISRLEGELNTAFARARREPRGVLEIDGLAVPMDTVRAGLLPAPGTRDELAKYIERESRTWAKVIAERKITAE